MYLLLPEILVMFAQVWHKSSSADEIPERDVTYHLIWFFIYHWTTTHLYFRNVF